MIKKPNFFSTTSPNTLFWGALFLTLATFGGVYGYIKLVGFLALFLLFLTATTLKKNWVSLVVFVIIGLCMLLHWIPGFQNPLWVQNEQLSETSLPLNIYFNFDKPQPALAYLITGGAAGLFHIKGLWDHWRLWFFLTVMCVVVLLGCGLITGYVAIDPKFPSITPIWVIQNLFFVCLVEEVFFRGFMQQHLTEFLNKKNLPWWVALVIVSAVFGCILHYRGGPIYMALATVAGLFYGYVYYRTQSLIASIMTHFLLNATHFFFLTYP